MMITAHTESGVNMMSYRYENATDKFIHITDEEPIMFQIQVVELTEDCIERIANAVVKKIKEGEADEVD